MNRPLPQLPALLLAVLLALAVTGCNRVTRWTPPHMGMEESPDVVVLVHAIWRWPGYSMRRLWEEGINRNYEVVYFRYSGLRADIEANTDRLAALLEDYRGRRISLVTHSYGGLIARHLLSTRSVPEIQRLVMIGTPNQGSAFADRWHHVLPYRWMFGSGGEELTPHSAQRLPIPNCEFGIIAGTGSGLNPWPLGENDGVVGLSEAYLPGAREFRSVRGRHEALPNIPRVVDAVYNFLETGSFGLDPHV